jgi:hypothetical protein
VCVRRCANATERDIQGDDLVVWALVDPGAVSEEGMQSSGPRRVIVANTGADVSIPEGARFLGTVTHEKGIVWHVFDGDAETTA